MFFVCLFTFTHIIGSQKDPFICTLFLYYFAKHLEATTVWNTCSVNEYGSDHVLEEGKMAHSNPQM